MSLAMIRALIPPSSRGILDIINIDDSDDGAESDKQVTPRLLKWEDSNNRQSSSKRSLSPSADEAGTKCKRTRRDSPAATDEETESFDRSPSPPLNLSLQPASLFQYSFDPSLHLSGGVDGATSTTAPIPASVVPVTATTATASTASSSSSTSSGSSKHIPFSANVRRYSPPPPKEGLYVPKAKYNPWD